jgi:hypothetical protein
MEQYPSIYIPGDEDVGHMEFQPALPLHRITVVFPDEEESITEEKKRDN